MSAERLRIILPSDVFPPRCGGAGWSAHTLARALADRGHAVTAVVPRQGAPGVAREQVLGVPTIRWGYQAPRLPFVQNYFRHERLWPRLSSFLVEEIRDWRLEIGRDQSLISNLQSPISNLPPIIHAQHVQTAPPAVMAGCRLGVPVVVTVRDHWPWDYFATGLHGNWLPYGRQTAVSLTTDLVARLGPARGLAALPAIPYMLAHVRRRQEALRRADAVIAVSGYVARRLAGIVPAERVHVIPNMLDLAAIDAALAVAPARPPAPYLLFVGKLERNKGAHLLIDIFRSLMHQPLANEDGGWRMEDGGSILHPPSSILNIPELVIAGDGPLRPELERELAALGMRARFLDWVEHDEVLRLMAGCTLLLFPSAWGEPLSRVPLEGSACGAPILAMPTGGTSDIIEDGVNGALEPTVAGFARRMAVLLGQPEQRLALGAAARRIARERFARDVVVARVEALYYSLSQGRR